MGIVSSVKAQDNHDQADGSRYVQEFHTDAAGKVHRYEYRWRAGIDRDAIMAARAIELAENLAQAEVVQAIGVDDAPAVIQQTAGQFLARLRERFRNAKREECARIARWIIRRLNAGHVTQAQLRAAFNLTVGQWNTLEAKLITLAGAADAIDSAEGE